MEKRAYKVLIVDDDPHLRSTLRDILRTRNFEVLTVSTGQEGLARVDAEEIDVALIDLRLTDMPGLEVLRGIKERSPDSECILLTGYASQESAIQALNLGAYSFALKPYDVDVLLLSVTRAAEKRAAGKALVESEKRYQTFINATTDMAFVKDEAFRYIIVNQTYANFFGKPVEEVIGRDDFELMAEEAAQSCRLSDKQALEENSTIVTLEPVGGRTYETRKFPVPLQNGRMGVGGYIRDVSEKLQVEQDLHNSEAHYRSLFEDSPISLWEEDFSHVKVCLDRLRKRGVKNFRAYLRSHPEIAEECISGIRIVDVNNATLALYKAKSKQHFIDSVKISFADDPVSFTEELVLIAEGKTSFQWEGVNQTLDGESLVISLGWSVAPGHENDLAKVIISIVDMTERKQAEQALQRSESSLQAVLQSTADGILAIGGGNEVLYANDRFVEMWRIPQEVMKSKDDTILLQVVLDQLSDPASFIKKVQDLYHSTEESFDILSFKDGRIYERLSRPLLIEAGKQGRVWSFRDITASMQAEQELRASEERYRMVTDNTTDLVFLMDLGMDITFVSPSVIRQIGYSLEEFVALPLEQFLTPDSIVRVKQAAVEELTPKSLDQTDLKIMRELEIEFIRKDGKSFWSECTFVLVRDEQGCPVNILGTGRDISERKKAEVEIQRQLNELEALYQNGLAINQLLDPVEIGRSMIDLFGRHFSWHHVAIRLREGNSDDLRLIAFHQPGLKKKELAALEKHFQSQISKIGQGLSGWAIKTGKAVRVGDVRKDPHYVETCSDICSGLYVPIQIGQNVIGSISVESEEAETFSVDDEHLLVTIANQAAIAFENAHLYQEVQAELAERQRVESNLRQSRQRLQAILDNTSAQVYIKDLDGRYLLVNNAMGSKVGIAQEEILGKTLYDLMTAEEAELHIRNDRAVLAAGAAGNFEEIHTEQDGVHTYLSVKFPLREEKGEIYAICGISTDITDLKKAEERLQLLSRAVEQSPASIVMTDPDGNVEYTNRSFSKVTGYEAEEVLGENLRILKSGATSAEEYKTLWKEITSGREWHGEFCNKKKNGDLFWESAWITPILDKNRKTAHFLAVKEDITERKGVESTLQRINLELEERVLNRTVELSSANLALEKAAKLKDEFLASMSHELRTPLTGVLGLTEALQRQVYGELNTRQIEILGTVEESGRHLLNLINDILDLSKIEAGRMELEQSRVSLDDLCQASLRLVKQMALVKHQSVGFDLKPTGLIVRADARRLKQVLFNLLGNAIKFTPENGELGLEVRGDAGRGEIRFTVWDQGIGISEEDQQRLFQPFVQLDSRLARNYPGTGLGLSLARRLVELHGGRIELESNLGVGSRFIVIIPWLKNDTTPLAMGERILSAPISVATGDKTRNGQYTILVADDNEVNIRLVSDFLTSQGYQVVLSRNGLQALEAVGQGHLDLVLMDIQMPGMDGLEAIRRIRSMEDPKLAKLPVIALTALVMAGDRERCLEAGANYYLTKPVNLGGLVEVVHLFLEKAR